MKLIVLTAEEHERLLDEALAMTFPASDPVSISADECISDEADSVQHQINLHDGCCLKY